MTRFTPPKPDKSLGSFWPFEALAFSQVVRLFPGEA
jgi:hypothetical protein